jgi:hypothetical protein
MYRFRLISISSLSIEPDPNNQAGPLLKTQVRLRKSAAVRLAEDGHSDHEIMAIGGWDTLKEVARYTKGVRRKRLAENVLEKRKEGQE